MFVLCKRLAHYFYLSQDLFKEKGAILSKVMINTLAVVNLQQLMIQLLQKIVPVYI